MRFRRRDKARADHPSSRMDLIALWGPDDDALDSELRPPPDAEDFAQAPPAGAEDSAQAPPAAPPAGAEDAAPPTAPGPPAAAGPGTPPGLDTPPAPDAPPAPDTPPVDVPSGPSRARGAAGGRVWRVALVAAIIAGALAIDRSLGGTSVPEARAAVPQMPSMAPAGALSSTWLCPALGASAASPVLGRLVLANPGPVPLTGTVTVIPASGAPIVQHPRLAPYSRQEIALETVAPGDYAAATVTFDGAGGAVEQEVHGALGDSVAPCTTGSSDHWYFPSGETDANASEYLSLYNPYPAPAIADLRFETDQGSAVPDAFQGVVVPASGFTVLDIGARVRSRATVATTVSVRGGRVVADELQVLSGSPHGLLLTLGAPALSTSWYYANGGVGPGVRERFDVYNPGSTEADVSAAPILDQGSADPFDVSVPPEGMVSLEVDTQARIPPGVGQAWALTSTNGAPFVAERVITSGRPATQTGVAATIGSDATAKRWVFGAGATTGGEAERLVIVNPGGADAHVSVVASGDGGAVHLPAVVVPAAGRASVDIGALHPAGVVMLDVTSDTPVVAERALYGTGPSHSVGIAGD
jgi:hypothetical protein